MSQQTQDPNYVIRQVIALQNRVTKQNTSIEDLDAEFKEFKMKCPSIYAKARTPMSKSDMDILLTMLKTLQEIRQDNVSHHQGSVEIGEMLVNSFVKPQLDSVKQPQATYRSKP